MNPRLSRFFTLALLIIALLTVLALARRCGRHLDHRFLKASRPARSIIRAPAALLIRDLPDSTPSPIRTAVCGRP